MKRILTIVSILSLVMASGAMAADYGWSISASSTSPNVNSATLVFTGSAVPVYLWLTCCDPVNGAAAAEFHISVTGAVFLGGYSAINGAVATAPPPPGTTADALLAFPCQTAAATVPFMAINTIPTGPGTVCLSVSDFSGKNVVADCTVANNEHAAAVIGFGNAGGVPCVVDVCTTTSVDEASWGGVKSLYR